MAKRLPEWMKNKWVLFGLSALGTLFLCLLIFLIFLKGPFASLFTKQGEAALKEQAFDAAQQKYSSALSLKKDREEIYLGYADALAGAGDYDRAIEILEQGIDRISGAEELYLRKVKIYVDAGKIGAAADFLDNIGNSYIDKKLQSLRPADLSYTPAQGKYGATQKVTLKVREGETVYYTLNGEDPTLSSSVYKEPITISSSTTLIAIAVSDQGMVSPRLRISYEIDNANEAIRFTDHKIEQMVRAALDRQSGSLYAAQLASVTDLTSHGIDGEITSLKDLEYLPALTGLHLVDELAIGDYSPLANLTSLTSLTLSGCALSDADLALINACTRLTSLTVSKNQLTTLEPIKDLHYLEHLDASFNEISSSTVLSEMPLLNYLYLNNNFLADTESLSGLSELITLDISNNPLSDLTPVTKLKNLTELYLAGTNPSNIKALKNLPNLKLLDISQCGLASLSVVNDFPALTVLYANGNSISSLSTFKKPVEELYISYNPLVDISPLKDQKNLTSLELAGTQIRDISPLSGLAKLATLDISYTQVTDATMLKSCPALTNLYCPENCSTADLPEQVYVVLN